MKIIQILPELNTGGVERGTLEIASRLVGDGHEAVVISNGGRLVTDLERSGSRHVTLPVHRKSLSSLLQVRAMRRFLTEEMPDIVHFRSRVPAWITWFAWRGMNPATRPRLVSTVHGFYSVNRYSAVMTRGERVIAVSESIRDYIFQNYPQTAAEIIRVIPRGIATDDYGTDFRPAADWLAKWTSEQAQLAGRRTLLLPGRITRLKGHSDFFHLLASLKQEGVPIHGLIAGDTHAKKQEYMGELHELAAKLGLATDVTFLGHRSDIREVMAVSDVTMALSQQPESFGRTVLEAMALGKPVVGYECGGVGELLGTLFPAGRVPMGNAAKLLEVTREILCGHETPAVVGEPFTVDAMYRATLGVYRELADAPRS